MFIVFAVIATLPLAAMSYLALTETRDALAAEVGQAHEDAAKAAASFVEAYVAFGEVLVTEAAADAGLANALLSGDDAGALDHARTVRSRTGVTGERIFAGVFVFAPNGTLVARAATDEEAVLRDASHQAAVALVVAQQSHVILPTPADGTPVLPVGAPVVANGTVVGVLVADLSLTALSDALGPFAPAETQTIYVADASGRLIVHPDSALVNARPDWSDVTPVALARAAPTGYVEYTTAEGVHSLGAYAPVERFGWTLVQTLPTAEAFGALSSLSAVLVVLSGILAGTILLASVVVARRIVAPVEELTAAARSLSDGDLTRRITPQGDDEIAQLAVAFNDMADRISESVDGIRRSESRYRSLVESANDLIFTIRPDGAFAFTSPLTRNLLDATTHSLVGQQAHRFVHERDRLVFLDAVRRVFERAEPALFVPFRFVTPEGATRTMLTNFSPVFDGGQKAAFVLAVAHDVTQERRQELIREKAFQMARLVSQEPQLERLADDGVGLLLGVSKMHRGSLYLAEPFARAGAAPEVPTPQEEEHDIALAHTTLQTGEPSRLHMGELYALGLPLIEQGETLGCVILVGSHDGDAEDTDVLSALASQLSVGLRRSLFEGRLREYAAELESRVAARTTELEAKSQEMEQFLYSVSHDLKAPLISIQGYAEALEEDYGPDIDEDGKRFLARMRTNASLMESLILDLLELSRIGRVEDAPVPVDLQDVLTEAAARLADSFEADGGTITIAPDLPVVRGQRKRLGQLFSNLLDNARKYRHADRPPEVHVTARDGGSDWIVDVKDNGRGIAEQHHDKLFDIFQRVPVKGVEDPGGTGMGLAIVKRIVETHGGTVSIDSREGEGTTFHLHFPKDGAP